MPSHDFGSPELFSFSDGFVTVASVPLDRRLEFVELEKKNAKDIKPFRIVIDNFRTLHSFGIFFDNVPVGEVSAWHFLGEGVVNLSFWVDEDFRRKGVAFSAVKQMCSFLMEKYQKDVYAHVLPTNTASSQLLFKLGFVSISSIVINTADGMKVHNTWVLRRDNANL